MSSTKNKDNVGRSPLPATQSKCCACAIINSLCDSNKFGYCSQHFEPIYDTMTHTIDNEKITINATNHMMTLNTIKFPNNICELLDFKLDFKGRKYNIGNDQDVFHLDKSDTFPLYCVTNSGSKYSLFGNNFLALPIRTYLCAIANYCQAIKMNASIAMIAKRISQINNARYNMDKKTIKFSKNEYLSLNVKWTSSIYDLYNIDRETLEQIIDKKCCVNKFLPEMINAINERYIFDVDLILNAASNYFQNKSNTFAYNAKIAILYRTVNTLIDEQKLLPLPLMTVDYIDEFDDDYNIDVNHNLIHKDIVKVLCPKNYNDILEQNFDALHNTLLLCNNINFHDQRQLDAFRLLIMNLSSYDINEMETPIMVFASYFFKAFPQNAVKSCPLNIDHKEIHFDDSVMLNGIADRQWMIKYLLHDNTRIASELKIMKIVRSFYPSQKTDYLKLMQYIHDENITFDKLHQIYLDIISCMKQHKNVKSSNDKQNALDFSYSRIHGFINTHLNKGINVITSILIKNTVLTEPIIRWFYSNNTNNFIEILSAYVVKIITKDHDSRNGSLKNKIERWTWDTNFCMRRIRELHEIDDDTEIQLYLDRIEENNKDIAIWQSQLSVAMATFDTSTIDNVLALMNKYRLYSDTCFRQSLSHIYDRTNQFPIGILKIMPIPKNNKVLNEMYNESLYFRNDDGYKYYKESVDMDGLLTDIQQITHYNV